MNYFEFFNIPRSFFPDLAAVKAAYFKKSREFHPDFFTNASDEEQAHALKQSSLNNIAYKTLINEDQRFAYILKLENQIIDGEKEILPQEFLFEMMDINEEIELVVESKDVTRLESLLGSIEELKSSLYSAVESRLHAYPDIDEEQLKQIKDYYFKSKYIKRISHHISKA